MADMMMFPDTVEEFMEDYKIVDSLQVYTNGIELVPIFRMKQWFEHKQGRWIRRGKRFPSGTDWMYCSECYWRTVYSPANMTNYCPNCGSYNGGNE